MNKQLTIISSGNLPKKSVSERQMPPKAKREQHTDAAMTHQVQLYTTER